VLAPLEVPAVVPVQTRGELDVVALGPDRTVLGYGGEFYALTDGVHHVGVPDADDPRGAWLSNGEGDRVGVAWLDPPVVRVVRFEPPRIPPDTLVTGAITATHAVVGLDHEDAPFELQAVDLRDGSRRGFPSASVAPGIVAGLAPRAAAVATHPLLGLNRHAKRAELAVHQVDGRWRLYEVTGVVPADRPRLPDGIVAAPTFYGHTLGWAQRSGRWEVVEACPGCVVRPVEARSR
jgi:hypothetical protein